MMMMFCVRERERLLSVVVECVLFFHTDLIP